jgi:CBS domain
MELKFDPHNYIPQRLKEIANQVHDGDKPAPETVRTFIGWFGAQRRGFFIVQLIRQSLQKLEIRTIPDFYGEYIDATIQFASVKKSPEQEHISSEEPIFQNTEGDILETRSDGSEQYLSSGVTIDPTFRIGRLESANRVPVYVNPNATLQEAITLMLTHDYSQLPVMQNDRDVKGIISWESIGTRLILSGGTRVREFMERHREVSVNDSLFTAIPQIIQYENVLVRGEMNNITGIITTSDLSTQFQQLSEPFLILSEIENHIRRLIDNKFTAQELTAAKNESDSDRIINSVADLTFGEYIRLLENPCNWEKIHLAIDRATFISEIEKIRLIRNDVVHFDPDGISEDSHNLLRNFVRFLQRLHTIINSD